MKPAIIVLTLDPGFSLHLPDITHSVFELWWATCINQFLFLSSYSD